MKSEMIFVTSLPRSGSTWAAQAIAVALHSRVINEPFNWLHHPNRKCYHMRYFRPGETDPAFIQVFHHHMRSPLPLLNDAWFGRNKVIKDVHACLALEPIWKALRPRMLLLIRHPCGMASSWAKLGLQARFRLDVLLGQSDLVKDFLEPFQAHINSSQDYFFEMGAYWGAAYFVMAQLSKNHPDWQWTSQEALCVESQRRYEAWISATGLNFSSRDSARLDAFLKQHNRESSRNYSATRVSSEEPEKWKRHLKADQIQSCLVGAAPFGLLEQFYDPSAPFITGALTNG
jgi:hypothetical protein